MRDKVRNPSWGAMPVVVVPSDFANPKLPHDPIYQTTNATESMGNVCADRQYGTIRTSGPIHPIGDGCNLLNYHIKHPMKNFSVRIRNAWVGCSSHPSGTIILIEINMLLPLIIWRR